MAKIDVGLPDISKAIADAEKYLAATIKITASYVEMAKAMKAAIADNPLSGAKDFNQMAAAMKTSEQALKDFNREKKNEQKLTAQLNAARDAEVKGRIRLQQATAEQKKILTEEIALENKSLGTKKRLQIENAKLTRSLDALNLETKEGVAAAKDYIRQIDINNAKIKQFSSAQAKGKLTVGQYTDSINKAKIGMMNFASALGVATGVFALTNALKGAFNIIRNNESALASLSAITGVTGAEFDAFEEKVTGFANSMRISSTEAAKLFEIVGSQMPQLLKDAAGMQKVAESAVILSRASGDTVEESTRALANVMNQFGLGADQADRAMNVLAAGSLVGSAGISDVSEAMKNFGSVAAGANVSVEESVALIEVLGKFSVTGAEAGTKLRGSLLKLQQTGFGYASGQFEINDALADAKNKLESYGTALEQDAFLQKTFGAENISTGRILLSNIDLFKEYTAGVTGTNVATEQAAINSDTLSFIVKELGAAWDNLVIKWADGTDVAGGLKDILRFVAENLEEIIGWVFKGAKAWILYKSTLTLVNNAGTGMFQMFRDLKKGIVGAQFSLGTFVKGLAGMAGIAAILIPMFIDIVKEIGEMISRTTALDRVTEKFNARMDEERAKMDLLRVEVLGAIGDKEKMEELTKRINAQYGTTLQNLEDETAMMNQLWEAYQKVNAEMEKRIMQQLLEEELTELFKARRAIEKAMKDSEDSFLGGLDYSGLLEDVNDDIAELNAELFALNNGFKNLGAKGRLRNPDDPLVPEKDFEGSGTGDSVDAEKKKLDRLAELRRLHAEDLIMFENEAIKAGYDRATIDDLLFMRKKELLEKELVFIQELNLNSRAEYEKTFNERAKLIDQEIKKLDEAKVERIEDNEAVKKSYIDLTDIMAAANKKLADEEAKRQQELIESIQKIQESFATLIQTMQEINEAKISSIQTEIDARKTEVQNHEDRVSEMKQLANEGVLTAEESIKAEEAKISVLENSIAELEAKKQKLLTINLGLQTALNLAESGDPAAIAKAMGQVGDFVSGLKSFKDGTDNTGAGGNLDKDGGFLSVLHPDEMVMQKELSDPLRMRGMDRHDVATYAMKYHDDILNGKAMEYGSFGDVMTLATLNGIKEGQEKMRDEIVSAIKSIPEFRLDYDPVKKALVESIITDGKIKNYFTFLKK